MKNRLSSLFLSSRNTLYFLLRQYRRALQVVVALLVFYALVGFLLLPWLARPYLENTLAETLHRPVSIESLSVNPFLFKARASGIEIRDLDRKGSFVKVAALTLDVQLSSIWHWAPVLREITIEQPVVHIVRLGSDRYNFSDLLESEPSPSAPDAPLPRFSLNNIRVVNGRIELDDRVAASQQLVSEINLAIPFLSTLPSMLDDYVEPGLSGRLNGTLFKLAGKSKPFDTGRETTLDFTVDGLDLPHYLAYAPLPKGLGLVSGRVSAQLQLVFQQTKDTPHILVRGSTELNNLSLQQSGQPLLDLPRLTVALQNIEPLNQLYQLGQVRAQSPTLYLRRAANGDLDLERLLTQPIVAAKPVAVSAMTASAASRVATRRASTVATKTKDKDKPKAPTPRLDIADLQMEQGRIVLEDAAVAPAFKGELQDIHLQVSKYSTVKQSKSTVKLSLHSQQGEKVDLQTSVQLQPLALNGQLTLANIQPGLYGAYLQDVLKAQLEGQVDLSGQFVFQTQTGRMEYNNGNLALRNFAITQPGNKQALVRLPAAQVSGIAINVPAQTIKASMVASQKGEINTVLARDGTLNLASLVVVQPGHPLKLPALAISSASAPASAAAIAAPSPVASRVVASRAVVASQVASGTARVASAVAHVARAATGSVNSVPTSWRVQLERAQVEGMAVSFADQQVAGAQPVVLRELAVQLEHLDTAPEQAANITLAGLVGKKGKVQLNGSIVPDSLAGQFQIDARGLDAAVAQAYFTRWLNIQLASGYVGAKGELQFALQPKLALSYKGGLLLYDFHAIDKISGDDFLKWRALGMRNIDAQLQPLRLEIGDVTLADFYSRLILSEKGRLNVQDIVVQDGQAASVTQTPAGGAAPARAVGKAPLPPIKINKITLKGGNINYSDHFVRPNFTANLVDMGGVISGISSDENARATLDLRGSVDRIAPVTVVGSLNPLAQKIYLNIKAGVKGYDLTAASTYSAKYAGYGIEKGKLSMDVVYTVENNQLKANNQLFLDQLTFGEQVDSPDATSLPVKFALALLKDRRGQINLSLPIEGSLDDPQFRVGRIIWQVIGNVLEKAVSSPFDLLGNLFGGSAKLSSIDFDPGSAKLTPAAQATLANLAQALTERPALQLDMSGWIDPATDPEGLKREELADKIRGRKLAQLTERGQSVDAKTELTISAAEYPQLLTQVYDREKLANKPRNAIGIAKTLPPAEMEKLLLAGIVVSDEDIRNLALQRAQAAKTALRQAGVDEARLFIVSPKLAPSEEDVSKDGGKASRVQFTLK